MPEKINVALLGATGKVGGLYLNLALEAEFNVLALARDPAKLNPREGLTVIKGDSTQPSDVAALISDVDVLVSCVGNSKDSYIMERTARNVLDAARARPTPPKVVFITSLGCSGTSWTIKMISILLGGKRTFEDYDAADRLIDAETIVQYVLVRPTGLTDLPGTGKYTVFRKGRTFAKRIARADVAQFLFDATISSTWNGPGGIQLGGFKDVN